MSWSTNFDKENGILEITFIGESLLDDIIKAVIYSMEFGKQNNVNLFLTDCREFVSNDSNSIFNAYNLGKFYEEIVVYRSFREAIIIPPDICMEDSMTFFETVVQNRGFSIRLFSDINRGREWLLDNQHI
jgi:hypothetical protein